MFSTFPWCHMSGSPCKLLLVKCTCSRVRLSGGRCAAAVVPSCFTMSNTFPPLAPRPAAPVMDSMQNSEFRLWFPLMEAAAIPATPAVYQPLWPRRRLGDTFSGVCVLAFGYISYYRRNLYWWARSSTGTPRTRGNPIRSRSYIELRNHFCNIVFGRQQRGYIYKYIFLIFQKI